MIYGEKNGLTSNTGYVLYELNQLSMILVCRKVMIDHEIWGSIFRQSQAKLDSLPVQNWKMPLKVSGSLASLMGFSAFGIGRIEPTNIRNTIDSIEATAAASCTAAAT